MLTVQVKDNAGIFRRVEIDKVTPFVWTVSVVLSSSMFACKIWAVAWLQWTHPRRTIAELHKCSVQVRQYRYRRIHRRIKWELEKPFI